MAVSCDALCRGECAESHSPVAEFSALEMLPTVPARQLVMPSMLRCCARARAARQLQRRLV